MITVDEPSLSVTIGQNTSPLAGQDGGKLTSRQIKDRLDAETVGNVSIRVLDTERPETWEVQGRGELQLAILVELMRREGFELTVGKPQVVIRDIDGKHHEPVERMTIDVPEEYVGVVTQLLALRRGRMEQMVNHGTGWVRMDYLVPARGLIGFRTEFLTETRGTGLLHHVFDRWEPWAGEMRLRPTGSLVADRRGKTASFALFNLQERGTLFVEPGEDVYEGMIVGENSRAEDLDVNACKEKHLTNMRSSTSDVLVRLVPLAQAVARPGARVRARGRVRRGHAALGAAAQGRARRHGPRPAGPRPSARLVTIPSAPMNDVTHLRTSLGGATLIGFWASIPSPLIAEADAAAGADYVVVDQQHGASGRPSMLAMLQAIQAGGAPSLVRVAANDAFVIGNALDLGAHGVIVPMVEDAEQAARRGLGLPVRARGRPLVRRAARARRLDRRRSAW